MDPVRVGTLLKPLSEAQRNRIVDLLRFPPDTVGGIMTNQLPVLPATLTVAAARQVLQDQLEAPDFVYYIYVVDDLARGNLQGVVTLREFVLATDDQSISEIMRGELATLDPLEPANGAARRVADEDLAAMPVVASDGRLLGAVTIDVAMRQIAPAGWSQQVPRVFS
jgi:Mg/Co/Ni transporter MgtE